MTNRVRKHKVEEAVKVDRIHFKRNEKEKQAVVSNVTEMCAL